MAPVVEKLTNELGIILVKLNADEPENEDMLRDYDVRSIPTLVLLEGVRHVGTYIGFKGEADLRSWLDVSMQKDSPVSHL
jgi:thioredoxin 2